MRNDIGERIRDALDLGEVVKFYGFFPNRSGFICCPFHEEKTPSLKLFRDNHWHCFGCREGGSVIDFVMKLFNLRFPEAVVRLNADFRLGLNVERADPREVDEFRRRRKAEEERKAAWERTYNERIREFRRLYDAYKNAPPDSATYAEACHKLPALEQWFEDNPYTEDRGR